MNDIVVRVENVSKKYKIGVVQRHDTLRDHLAASFKNIVRSNGRQGRESPEIIWALKNVSFEVNRGEILGIIGPNGAGKSTLLKILTRITVPTEGGAEIRGRVGSLLEVGTGFHPELTGRDNIYLNGTLLGMKRSEINKKLDEIVDFSGVEKFIDTPVKRYSSGMYVRLAFAVAAHLEPDILIVDEVLAVGDAQFQSKCIGKIRDASQKERRTVLFVSHNMAAVSGLCTKGILLEGGQIAGFGDALSIVEQYIGSLFAIADRDIGGRVDRLGDGKLRFTDVKFLNKNFDPVESFISGQEANIAIGYKVNDPDQVGNIEVAIAIRNNSKDIQLTALANSLSDAPFESVPDSGYFVCTIPRLPLVSGPYSLNLFCRVNGIIADWIINTTTFRVEAGDFYGTGRNADREQSLFLVDNSWKVLSSLPHDHPFCPTHEIA